MKTFPILRPNKADLERLAAADITLIEEIPWALIARCEARARLNHGGRTLEQLAAEGGLSANETVNVLRDWQMNLFTVEAAYMQLRADLDHWMASADEEPKP